MSVVSYFYAQILFDIDPNARDLVLELKKAFTKKEIHFFNSSLISIEKKKQVIEACNLPQDIQQFLNQITLKRRWKYFDQICDKYLHLCDKKNHILRGVVFSVISLSKDQLNPIKESLKRFFPKKEIILENKVDSSLIQGIRVKIGGYSFDNSSIYHLNKFRSQITGNTL